MYHGQRGVEMSKWVCTVIQNMKTGKYNAIMEIEGKSIDNLPVDANYSTLRREIKRITNKEIPLRKHMIFERLSNFEKISTLDCTQCRSDCRVTLAELIKGWEPCWNW